MISFLAIGGVHQSGLSWAVLRRELISPIAAVVLLALWSTSMHLVTGSHYLLCEVKELIKNSLVIHLSYYRDYYISYSSILHKIFNMTEYIRVYNVDMNISYDYKKTRMSHYKHPNTHLLRRAMTVTGIFVANEATES